jgi:hypothetical protein
MYPHYRDHPILGGCVRYEHFHAVSGGGPGHWKCNRFLRIDAMNLCMQQAAAAEQPERSQPSIAESTPKDAPSIQEQ